MYKLYFSPGACSLATQVVLRELSQPVELINKQSVENFDEINPVGVVPLLLDGQLKLKEGAAIMLYLLEKHPNSMLPKSGELRQLAIQDIMFANATMHPAYGRLFFIERSIASELDKNAKLAAFNAAADAINQLWGVVETRLVEQDYLGGTTPSAADIMLAVYARWGEFFPVDIKIGKRTQAMLNKVQSMTSFQQSIDAENALAAV